MGLINRFDRQRELQNLMALRGSIKSASKPNDSSGMNEYSWMKDHVDRVEQRKKT